MSLLILNIIREIFENLVKRKDVCFRQKAHEHLNLHLVSEIHRSHLMLFLLPQVSPLATLG